MAFYAGSKGRIVLFDPVANTSWNLSATKYLLTVKTQEEDVTTATSGNVHGRKFVASPLPRIDFQFDAFWTSTNNPFGKASPLLPGKQYTLGVFFDKDEDTFTVQPNIDAQLLILGCELQSSVRDMVRFVVNGIINGALNDSLIDVFDVPAIYFPRA